MRGAEEDPYEPPQKRTWAEKVTDDSNAWLHARRLELEGDLGAAAEAYARDKETWLGRNRYARAALSSASAARCLSRLAVDGGTAFHEAAELFMEAARLALASNPLNALQLFDRAEACYRRSGDEQGTAEAARYREALQSALDAASGAG